MATHRSVSQQQQLYFAHLCARLLRVLYLFVLCLAGAGPWSANIALASPETDLVRAEIARSTLVWPRWRQRSPMWMPQISPTVRR